MPPEDTDIIDFTRRLIRKHRVEASVGSMCKRFGDEGFVELTGTIGYYTLLPMTVKPCELAAAAGAAVLQV
jgi:hypothetical protein